MILCFLDNLSFKNTASQEVPPPSTYCIFMRTFRWKSKDYDITTCCCLKGMVPILTLYPLFPSGFIVLHVLFLPLVSSLTQSISFLSQKKYSPRRSMDSSCSLKWILVTVYLKRRQAVVQRWKRVAIGRGKMEFITV